MKLYFAYGSNMWQQQMDERCPDHKYFGQGTLRGFRWIISARGYANVIQSDGDEVHGVVYRINEEDETNLDKEEGVHNGSYRKEVLPVRIEDTNDYRCMVYVDPIEAEGAPIEEYIGRINKAVADADLPLEYVDRYIRKFIPLLK
jgi:cation transport regulator ChaC